MPCFLKVSSRPRFTDTNGEFLVEVEPKYLFVNNCKYLQDLSIMQIIFRICCQERAFQVSLSRVRTVLETHLSFNGTRLVGIFDGGKICIINGGQDLYF